MKIDPKSIFDSVVGTKKEDKKESGPASILKSLPNVAKDILESATKSDSPLFPKLPVPNGIIPPNSDQNVFGELERQMLKARMGSNTVSKLNLNGEEEIFSDSDETKKKDSKSWGDNEELKKKYSDVSGALDFKKGTTLFDIDEKVFRLPIDGKLKDEKAGTGSAKGRLDILSARLRGFYEADFKPETLTGKLGLGLQGALEVVGFHDELKHSAPDVKLAGRDASWHTLINVDAYVGVVAEAEATLNIDVTKGDGFLRLGAQAFATATASISGESSIGKMATLKGKGNAYAGAGAGIGLDVGFKDGSFKVSHGAGAAVAYGAGYEIGFSVNLGELGKVGEGMVKDVADQPTTWVWDKNFPWPWKPNFIENFHYPPSFVDEFGHALAVNLGSRLGLLDYLFSLSGKSDVPSEYSQKDEPNKTTELEDKKNSQPSQPAV